MCTDLRKLVVGVDHHPAGRGRWAGNGTAPEEYGDHRQNTIEDMESLGVSPFQLRR